VTGGHLNEGVHEVLLRAIQAAIIWIVITQHTAVSVLEHRTSSHRQIAILAPEIKRLPIAVECHLLIGIDDERRLSFESPMIAAAY
jgi:hypothetical protein